MTKLEELLIVFVKNPEMGKVKTRLARSIGEREALQIYQQLLTLTKEVTDNLNCIKQIWYSNNIDDHDLWDSGDYEKYLQKGANLGERMKNAFKHAFEKKRQLRTIIIGSDCADLTPEIILRGFQILKSNDLVIGPSKDGGYYLLGMSSFYPELFEDIAWSTKTVFEKTMQKAQLLDLKTQILPALNDIDTKEDLIKSDKVSREL